MNYIVCEEPGSFLLKEKEAPTFGKKEALLQVKNIGICGTDLHAYGGNQAFFEYPRILGHELSAKVVAIGEEVDNVQPGDRVLVMPYVSCGTCFACKSGKSNCCVNMKVLGVHIDGGMQEQINVPAQLLIPLNDLSYEEIAIIEPLAIGAHALRRAKVKEGDKIVVVGCGPIGLGIMKLAQIKGAEVIAIDVNEKRLKFAKEVLGIPHTVMAKEDAVAQVKELTDGDLAAMVFDATGNKFALESGIQYMAHGGSYILVGLSKEKLCFHHPSIHAKESTLLCSRNATPTDFHFVIEVLQAGAFPYQKFITHRVAFDQMISTFDNWLDPEAGVIKAMVAL